MKVNQKLIEIIHNVIVMQNTQLLKIIAEEEGLNFKKMEKQYITTRTDFYHNLQSSGRMLSLADLNNDQKSSEDSSEE